jgi:hypothetical protein
MKGYAFQFDDCNLPRIADSTVPSRVDELLISSPGIQENDPDYNLPERVQKELRRRSRKIGVFLNDASLLRLAGSIPSISMKNGLQVIGIYHDEGCSLVIHWLLIFSAIWHYQYFYLNIESI